MAHYGFAEMTKTICAYRALGEKEGNGDGRPIIRNLEA